MKPMKSLKLAFVSTLVAMALAACAAGKPAWTGDPELARKLTLKMPEGDVRKLLGEPTSTGEFDLGGVTTSYLDYDGVKDVRVVLQEGKVVGVVLNRVTILQSSVSDI